MIACELKTSDVHAIYDYDSGRRINNAEDIVIKNHVWVNQNNFIGKGLIIGSGTVIEPYSMVKGHLDSNYTYSGNPLKKIKESIFWLRPDVHNYQETKDKKIYQCNQIEFSHEDKNNNNII